MHRMRCVFIDRACEGPVAVPLHCCCRAASVLDETSTVSGDPSATGDAEDFAGDIATFL